MKAKTVAVGLGVGVGLAVAAKELHNAWGELQFNEGYKNGLSLGKAIGDLHLKDMDLSYSTNTGWYYKGHNLGLKHGVLQGREEYLASLVPFEPAALKVNIGQFIATPVMVRFDGQGKWDNSGPFGHLKFSLFSTNYSAQDNGVTAFFAWNSFYPSATYASQVMKPGEMRHAIVEGSFSTNNPANVVTNGASNFKYQLGEFSLYDIKFL